VNITQLENREEPHVVFSNEISNFGYEVEALTDLPPSYIEIEKQKPEDLPPPYSSLRL
jgi:hypothetical protein